MKNTGEGWNPPINIDYRTEEEKRKEWDDFQDQWDAYLEKIAEGIIGH
tara:strand:- start:886 stop:1029 length:144 start_codon:yes stop_codon:yes gene_type:complete